MDEARWRRFHGTLICRYHSLDSCRARSRGKPTQAGHKLLYLFENYVLDTQRRELRCGAGFISVQPQVFDLLEYLLRNRERVVSKDDLIADIWGGRVVSESALATRINAVRAAIGDNGDEQRLIKTLPRKGVRFTAVVREQRMPSEVGVDPEAPSTAPADRPSIAVLPFLNLSGDPEQEYFADGMVDEILTSLSRIRWLIVTSRTSTFALKGQNIDVRDIARKLGVRYLLEGSVRKASNRVRIVGQLIDAVNGAHIWADRIEGNLDDIFDLQDRVTASVVGAIEPKIRHAEIERAKRKRPDSLDAYDLYLRSLPHFYQLTRVTTAEGLKLLQQSLELDPAFAPANALAAWAYYINVALGWSSDTSRDSGEATRLAREALANQPDDPQAIANAGWVIGTLGQDLDAGLTALEEALQISPNCGYALSISGFLMTLAGDQDKALEQSLAAVRVSPTDPLVYRHYSCAGIACILSGRFEDAIAYCERARRYSGQWPVTFRVLAAAHAQLGHLDEAKEALARMLEISPSTTISLLKKALPYRNTQQAELLWDGLRRAGLQE
jgi:TolB-like protein/Flp pilus assembly protein TadD